MSGKSWLIFLISLLVLSTIIDFGTAISNPMFKEAEINPIYVYTNSIFMTLLTVIMVTTYIVWNLLKKVSGLGIYFFVLLTLYLVLGHFLGAYTNIKSAQTYYGDPENTIQKLSNMDEAAKINSYASLVGILMMIPLIISLFGYYLSQKLFEDKLGEREKIIGEVSRLIQKLNF